MKVYLEAKNKIRASSIIGVLKKRGYNQTPANQYMQHGTSCWATMKKGRKQMIVTWDDNNLALD